MQNITKKNKHLLKDDNKQDNILSVLPLISCINDNIVFNRLMSPILDAQLVLNIVAKKKKAGLSIPATYLIIVLFNSFII